MPIIEVKGVRKAFDGRPALEDVSFSVEKGQTLVILGGSGTGKSTLLKVMITALKPDAGEVWLDGEEITALPEGRLGAARRKFGVLFQEGALLGSMTVGQNVALPIRYHTKLPPETIDIMVKVKLELVGLRDADEKLPSQLSGGMRKRASLARAMALDPKVVYYDEPSSGLDPVATAVIDELIRDLGKKMGLTNIVVTHDITSAFRIADRIVLLHGGRIAAQGTPDEIKASDDPLVQQFITGSLQGPLHVRGTEHDYYTDLLTLD